MATANPIHEGMEITCLDLGHEFVYRIPLFSVLCIPLRQTTVQIDDQTCVYDAFINADPVLPSKTLPYCLELRNFCFVPVSDQYYLIRIATCR